MDLQKHCSSSLAAFLPSPWCLLTLTKDSAWPSNPCEWRLTDGEKPETRSLAIRNSTAEFLIFQIQNQTDSIEVMYADVAYWCFYCCIVTPQLMIRDAAIDDSRYCKQFIWVLWAKDLEDGRLSDLQLHNVGYAWAKARKRAIVKLTQNRRPIRCDTR